MVKQPFTYEEFREIYSKVPRLTVEVVIKTTEGILLTLRALDSWKGMWHLPGGTVYYKETLEQAVKRVAKEELGIEVAIDRQLGIIEYLTEEQYRGFGSAVGIVYVTHIVSGTPKPIEQASDVKYFTSIPENMVIEQKEFLHKHLQEILK